MNRTRQNKHPVLILVLALLTALLISIPAWAEDIQPIGSGRHFLDVCEKLVRDGKAHSVSDAIQGSYCLGYINGLSQVYASKDYNNTYVQDIGIMYILYLNSHPNDLNQDNSVLFKRMMMEHK